MPPKGWKKNSAGQWYDPEAAPGSEIPAGETVEAAQAVEGSQEETGAETVQLPGSEVAAERVSEPKKNVVKAGELSLTKIPAKHRKFAKGL